MSEIVRTVRVGGYSFELGTTCVTIRNIKQLQGGPVPSIERSTWNEIIKAIKEGKFDLPEKEIAPA